MKKSITSFIIKKFLRFDKEQPFIYLSAILAFFGIAIGIMVLMVTMAIMNGTYKEFERKLSTMNYPLTIMPLYSNSVDKTLLENLELKYPELLFSPFLSSQAIAKSGARMEGAILFGVDFIKEAKVNSIIAKAVENKKIKKFQMIIGKTLFDEFNLTEGEKLTYIFTNFSPSGISLTPTLKRFKTIGHFTSGLNAYDKAYGFTDIESLRRVLHSKKDVYDGIHIYSKDPMNDINRIKKDLDGSIQILGWWQQNGNFFSALEMEKRALFLVLMLIILVASINIISSLLMTVMHRRNDIALLLSLGTSPRQIKKIFLTLGLIIGLGGMAMGIGLGFGSIYLLQTYDIVSLPADVYGSSKLPVDLDTMDFIYTVFGAISITLISAWYPAHKASKTNLLQVLRNE